MSDFGDLAYTWFGGNFDVVKNVGSFDNNFHDVRVHRSVGVFHRYGIPRILRYDLDWGRRASWMSLMSEPNEFLT